MRIQKRFHQYPLKFTLSFFLILNLFCLKLEIVRAESDLKTSKSEDLKLNSQQELDSSSDVPRNVTGADEKRVLSEAEILLQKMTKPEKSSIQEGASLGAEEKIKAKDLNSKPIESKISEELSVQDSSPQAPNSQELLNSSQEEKLPWARMVIFLFSSCVLISLLAWGVKRWKGHSLFQDSSNLPLRILQTLSLGLKREIIVLSMEGKKILIGFSANQMQLLYTEPSLQGFSDREEKKSVYPSDKNLDQKIASSVAESYSKLLEDFKKSEKDSKAQEQILNQTPEKLSEKIRNVVFSLHPLRPNQNEVKTDSSIHQENKSVQSFLI